MRTRIVINKEYDVKKILIYFFLITIMFLLLFIKLQRTDFVTLSDIRRIFFIIIGVFYIYKLFMRGKFHEKFVSELILTENILKLIYRSSDKTTDVQELYLNEIESVHVKLTNLKNALDTTITIKLKNDSPIVFSQISSDITFFRHTFILKLLKIARFIPNFSYEISGSSFYIEKDIESFIRSGKRLSLIKALPLVFLDLPKAKKISVVTAVIVFFILLTILILLILNI